MRLNRVKLINARHAKGLSQEAVAEKANLSILTVNKAEQGGNVFPDTARKLAEVYEIDLSDLMIPLKEGRHHEGNGDGA